MSHPELSSFNPFVPHPFTAGGTPPEASPMQTPAVLAYEHNSPSSSSGSQSASDSPVGSPLNAPERPIYAPKPIPSYVPHGVFEQYDRGRVTPDLVIRKKLNNWGAQREFR